MKKSFFVLVFSVLFTLSALGQPDPNKKTPVQAAVFVAPGGISSCCGFHGTLHFGGTVDAQLKGGLGATADLGYLTPYESLTSGIGIFSPGVVFKFNRGHKTEPFVAGGYSLFFRSGAASGLFFGGGVDHWFGKTIGIRIEGRDQVLVEENDHFLEARFAVLFR